MDTRILGEVADALAGAQRILFVTGAGVSADSGLPTYRGVGGLYEGADTPEGRSIEEILSGPTMRRDPALCWRHIAQIEAACRGAEPNRAHRAIAELAERAEVVVLTQNVDGLHRRAAEDRGSASELIEIHGAVHQLRCTACRWRSEVEDYAELDLPPRCPDCGGLVRPDVVLFEEWLPEGAVAALQRAMARPFDLVVTIGTTSGFPYIAAPVVEQVRAGRPAAEINPGQSMVSELVTWRLRARAADAMEALLQRVHGRRGDV